MGEHCRAFEDAFADYVGTRHAVMVNSGSSANLLMVAALVYTGRLLRGSLVAVPAVGWSTTYAPLEQFGMRVAVVDIDGSFTIDPHLIPTVDATFAVNLLGNPCEYDKLPGLVLEDNCEALGAEYMGQKTGSFGLMASHSMFFSHHMNTMEGGVVTTDDEELWRCLVSLRAHGWTRDWPDREPGTYRFEVPGFSVRPTEVQGAIGREQLKRLPELLKRRRENGEAYKRLIGHQHENGSSSWFGFPVLASAECRDHLSHFFETRPIMTGNILRQPMAKWLEIESTTKCTWADHVTDYGFMIGNHPESVLAEVAEILSVHAA